MRTIGLLHSAGEKLARFLLDLSSEHDAGKRDIKRTLTLTHEENRPDDMSLPRDRDAVVRRFQEKTALANNRFNAYRQG
jgi:hypothetical protein